MKYQIVYYTCNTHEPKIDDACRQQLFRATDYPIVSVSLNKPLDFGSVRLTTRGLRSPEMMHKQVLMGLEAATADYIFLCESDVLYHESHFDFIPSKQDVFYYNNNVWKMRWDDKFLFRTDDMKQVSGICASRELLLDFYRKRNEQIQGYGFNRHYEPGLKQTVGSQKVETWNSAFPNICIRHDSNITKTKYSPEEFRDKKYAKGWKETTINKLIGWDL